MPKIANVKFVTISLLKSNPSKLEIKAEGQASSGGWSNARLNPTEYIMPPADGIYDFTFEGDPPSGNAPTVMSLKYASLTLDPCPAELKGVRVIAATNKIECLIMEGTSTRSQPVGQTME